ncbi:MAG: hypothetical protein HY864_11505 [Chloroflexi bacterium]|nr:hypothetical protein [Chloroflexota bacterium]
MKFQCVLLGFALLFLSGCSTIRSTPNSQDNSPSQPLEQITEPIITNEWAVRLATGVDPDQLALEYGAENLGQIGTLQDTYLFRRACKILNEDGLDPMANDERVLWLERQIPRQQNKRNGDQNEQPADACN